MRRGGEDKNGHLVPVLGWFRPSWFILVGSWFELSEHSGRRFLNPFVLWALPHGPVGRMLAERSDESSELHLLLDKPWSTLLFSYYPKWQAVWFNFELYQKYICNSTDTQCWCCKMNRYTDPGCDELKHFFISQLFISLSLIFINTWLRLGKHCGLA